ncbi:FapA family protein [Salipaludibacillus sp. CUR1]|uniref:DUF342 domain-containing protein n=1 Tax=Salipaludibacillus sp. CUR1 TaxID=2820003 RepID=UPI001E394BBB|nr:FapA family protein [Salipaludibacillus sp. CUR1]MCE7794579.1 FapA family protein [Salipaludibacillus sp. CUR1]
MGDLHDLLEVEVSEDHLLAVLKERQPLMEEIKADSLSDFISEHGITYGILDDELHKFAAGKISLPVVAARGKEPVHGRDAYIWSLLDETADRAAQLNEKSDGEVNLKKVIDIPQVKAGAVIGRKIEAEPGTNGLTVYGKTIKAKKPRDIKLRPGKNTRIEGSEIISSINGQLSVAPKVIHVYPVYEVNGDLNMKTGNIDFVGNVVVRGNVPSGFSIKAIGDIRIYGSVEAADIQSEGSVFIHQGVVAQNAGLIKVKGDVRTSFLNQATIEAGGDVHITTSILHSRVDARGFVFCKEGRGNIVGGSVSSGKGIEVNEVGNHMSTPTALYLGTSAKMTAAEKKYKKQLNDSQEECQKLAKLLKRLKEKGKGSTLSPKEKVMLLRVRNSLIQANEKLNEAKDQLLDFQEIFDGETDTKVRIYQSVYPNTDLHFGKYVKKITTAHQHVQFRKERSEIKFEAL